MITIPGLSLIVHLLIVLFTAAFDFIKVVVKPKRP
jgi:hypothetical protein